MPHPSFIVTGASGFIGCNIVAELNRRGFEDILVVDEPGGGPAKEKNLASVRYREFMDLKAFRQAVRGGKMPPAAALFHLGACSSTTEMNEGYLQDNNFLYTRELCEGCLAKGVRFVYASSAATYGDGERGYSDDDAVAPTLRPLNPYGVSKQTFDLWAMEKGVLGKIAGLKYFNVYGPHEDHKGDMRSVVNKAYQQILDTGEIRLFKSYRPEYADGAQERDFVYVKDAVDVTLWFHDHPEVSGLFNCGTGKARTWVDLAKAVFTAMNRPAKIVFIDMPETLRERYQYHTQADMTKLRKAGYSKPFTSLEAGVKDYVQSYLARD